MEVDYRSEYVQGFCYYGQQALGRLLEQRPFEAVAVPLAFVARYVSLPPDAHQTEQVREVMIRMAQTLYTVLPELNWPNIAAIWPGILASALELANPELEAVIAMQLAVVQNNLGRSSQAQSLYEDLVAKPWFVSLPLEQQAGILHQFGVCLVRNGDLRHARRVLEQSLVVADEPVDSATMNAVLVPPTRGSNSAVPSGFPSLWQTRAFSLHQLGHIAYMEGRWEAAGHLYHRSLDEFEAHGEADDLACVAYQSLGTWHLATGQAQAAVAYLERALRAREQRGERAGTAHAQAALADALVAAGSLERAESLLCTALATHRDLGDRRGEALARLSLGRMERTRGNPDGALDEWREALRILQLVPLPSLEMQVRLELSKGLLRKRQFRRGVSEVRPFLVAYWKQHRGFTPALRLFINTWVKRVLTSARPSTS